MGLEIRKVPKWDKAKIDDKLLILRQKGESSFSILYGVGFFIIGLVILDVFQTGGGLNEGVIIVFFLFIFAIICMISGILEQLFYTRRTD